MMMHDCVTKCWQPLSSILFQRGRLQSTAKCLYREMIAGAPIQPPEFQLCLCGPQVPLVLVSLSPHSYAVGIIILSK